jgi:DNA replication and repair protein RecF
VRVTRLRLRDFRCYERAVLALGDGVTVLHGHNGAGKTNLLEGLYFACTGRSCRTSNEREVVRFGCPTARLEVDLDGPDGGHGLTVGFTPGEPKHMAVDGAPVDSLLDVPQRPLISVFSPDRLELIKGPPALRRSHLDQLVGALWPARSATRRAYARALAQRNALLARVRAGQAPTEALDAWDGELARHGVALRDDRRETVERLAAYYRSHASELGLAGEAELRYRPRSRASCAAELADELRERRSADLERGFTGHGPHRDELSTLRDERELRAYGSQGEQRLALLALLLAERDVIAATRPHVPVMLLDDVMSELDDDRRVRLMAILGSGGQTVLTTTDLAHVPGGTGSGIERVAVSEGSLMSAAVAA